MTSSRTRRDFQALAEFRYQLRRFIRVSEEAARAAGLEPQHHQVLLAIAGAPDRQEPSIAWLAERMQLRHHSVVGLVDRLEERGLVRRHPAPDDQRRVLVEVTPRGLAALDELSMLHRTEIRSRAPALVSAMMAIVRHGARPE